MNLQEEPNDNNFTSAGQTKSPVNALKFPPRPFTAKEAGMLLYRFERSESKHFNEFAVKLLRVQAEEIPKFIKLLNAYLVRLEGSTNKIYDSLLRALILIADLAAPVVFGREISENWNERLFVLSERGELTFRRGMLAQDTARTFLNLGLTDEATARYHIAFSIFQSQSKFPRFEYCPTLIYLLHQVLTDEGIVFGDRVLARRVDEYTRFVIGMQENPQYKNHRAQADFRLRDSFDLLIQVRDKVIKGGASLEHSQEEICRKALLSAASSERMLDFPNAITRSAAECASSGDYGEALAIQLEAVLSLEKLSRRVIKRFKQGEEALNRVTSAIHLYAAVLAEQNRDRQKWQQDGGEES